MSKLSNNRGFTLVELMIVVAIVAILLAVGLPSYQNSVTRSHRVDAQTVLQGFAQAMERHQANNNFSYVGAATGVIPSPPLGTVYPNRAPLDGDTIHYNLTIQAVTASSFTLRATPISPRQTNDGFIEINSLGRRSWDKDNNSTISTSEQKWEH